VTKRKPEQQDLLQDALIREVTEDLREEQLAQFWSRFGKWIVAAAVAVVAVVAGREVYDYYTTEAVQADAVVYEDAIRIRTEEPDKALAALQQLAAADKTGYGLLARFQIAADKGKVSAIEGYESLMAVANDAAVPALYQDLARVQAVVVALNTAEVQAKTLNDVLQPMLKEGNAFYNTAHELAGTIAMQHEEYARAQQHFSAVLAAENVSVTQKNRVRQMFDDMKALAYEKGISLVGDASAKADSPQAE
jgi:hypothetical protein